jgi:hypothetical protein
VPDRTSYREYVYYNIATLKGSEVADVIQNQFRDLVTKLADNKIEEFESKAYWEMRKEFDEKYQKFYSGISGIMRVLLKRKFGN